MGGIRGSYRHTRTACYIGYIVQAIVNNYAPLLFVTFRQDYSLSFQQIGLLVAANFCTQLVVDFLATQFVDRIGYRKSIVIAHVFSVAGLLGLAVLPNAAPSPFAGLILAMALYAVGGGLIEVLISPIVDSCPKDGKSDHMSLLHSFYCWGFALVVFVSTMFFSVAGIGKWPLLACLWAIVPAVNLVYFLFVPMCSPEEHTTRRWSVRTLLKQKVFWVFVLLMICAGAAEQSMSQWISAFVESGLNVPKLLGDMLGPCVFALLMGVTRTVFGVVGERIDLRKYMTVCGVVCVAGYMLAAFSGHAAAALAGCALCGITVGIMWPGTISIAAKSALSSTAMFALLALAGDIGAISGPAMVGVVAGNAGGSLQDGIASVIIFPVIMTAVLFLHGKSKGSLRRSSE